MKIRSVKSHNLWCFYINTVPQMWKIQHVHGQMGKSIESSSKWCRLCFARHGQGKNDATTLSLSPISFQRMNVMANAMVLVRCMICAWMKRPMRVNEKRGKGHMKSYISQILYISNKFNIQTLKKNLKNSHFPNGTNKIYRRFSTK